MCPFLNVKFTLTGTIQDNMLKKEYPYQYRVVKCQLKLTALHQHNVYLSLFEPKPGEASQHKHKDQLTPF